MQPICLKDYKDPSFSVSNTELFFEVLKDKIIVSSKLKLLKHNDDTKNLILNGEDLKTLSIALNSKVLDESQYKIADNLLEIFNVNNNDVIEIKVEINPFTNTKLMGIYKSNSCLCSQCEPEGFRRITWYIDAPNNMSLWKVSILSNDADYEYVLSNGNLIHSEVKDGKRLSVFEDPFAKPSYLFAFVAGNFDEFQDFVIKKRQMGFHFEYRYVSNVASIRGLDRIRGLYIGTYKERPDLPELKEFIHIIKTKHDIVDIA